ncbi:MAG: NAD(P)-dependent alcohol dehydrogenase [Candidatus Woesearchaeota archaeon]|nr:NAD(P)-dependent alcohol dehydrogenase [Candidatus Woesearchaeota archaeon]
MVHAYAARAQDKELEPFEYELPERKEDEIDINVAYCGICHSDLSMLQNDWHMTQYPFVPGHEVVGTVTAVGTGVKHLSLGQQVGVGWFTNSCTTCEQCMRGEHNHCPTREQMIVGRHGGFADTVRCGALWATPLPDEMDLASAGPLFCGGITVFNPIAHYVKPTDKVAVIGIGGLGHLALQFLSKWGCEVTAFTSSEDKMMEAKLYGAHHTVNSRDPDAIGKCAGQFDFVLNTTNANLPWEAYVQTLQPHGRFHTVGAVPDPIPLQAFSLIVGQKSVSGSPLGSPALVQQMLAFCVRHGIKPKIEEFALADVNAAMQHLKDGKARYRIVLKVS